MPSKVSLVLALACLVIACGSDDAPAVPDTERSPDLYVAVEGMVESLGIT